MLLKLADPPPSFVLVVNNTVGVGDVDQQTPFAVIAPPPLEAIVPPETAEVWVIAEAVTLVTVGANTAFVMNVCSDPYAVPALLVA